MTHYYVGLPSGSDEEFDFFSKEHDNAFENQ